MKPHTKAKYCPSCGKKLEKDYLESEEFNDLLLAYRVPDTQRCVDGIKLAIKDYIREHAHKS